jgi:hypothetical protein
MEFDGHPDLNQEEFIISVPTILREATVRETIDETDTQAL